MGLFRPLVSKSMEITSGDQELSDRKLTVANGMTLSRPLIAGKAAHKLITGEKGVTPWVAVMAISDAEGTEARLGDKYFPGSWLGSSEIGAEWDPIADTAAIITVGSAGLIAPRMPVLGRAAIATALGHEGYKAAWAIGKNKEYKAIAGKSLKIAPTIEGKESMAEKFSAIILAVAASDFDNQYYRQTLSAAALGLAVTGSLRAESQRRVYNMIADNMIADLQPELNSELQEAA